MSPHLLGILLVLLPLAPLPPGGGGDGPGHLTVQEALELAFPKARSERRTFYLTAEQVKEASRLAREKLRSKVIQVYTARDREGRILGRAYFDRHRVRTLPETLMVAVDPAGKVLRIEVLAFGEPREYLPRGALYGQFRGRGLDEDLQVKRGIRGVAGATLTARATTAAVRRVLALDQVLFHPRPGRTATAEGS